MKDKKYSQEIDFLKNGPWDEFYVLTEHWESDLKFYRDDLRFLHHLIDKYFIWLIEKENIKLVKELKQGVLKLKTKGKDLLDKAGKHRIQIGHLVVDSNRADAGIIKTEHEHLEEEMAQFVKLFRENRKEVFRITEYIIDSEKLGNILTP